MNMFKMNGINELTFTKKNKIYRVTTMTFQRSCDMTLTAQRNSQAHCFCRHSDYQQPQSAVGQASEELRVKQKRPVVC